MAWTPVLMVAVPVFGLIQKPPTPLLKVVAVVPPLALIELVMKVPATVLGPLIVTVVADTVGEVRDVPFRPLVNVVLP